MFMDKYQVLVLSVNTVIDIEHYKLCEKTCHPLSARFCSCIRIETALRLGALR